MDLFGPFVVKRGRTELKRYGCLFTSLTLRAIHRSLTMCSKFRQLHHFSDASENGYGTVTYIRLQDAASRVHCVIVMSKCRVAPIKQMTMPRLELSAAALSVKMDQLIRHELDIEIHESVFWTDSTTVLQYIRNTDKRFQTFVANRVAVIHEGSTIAQWRYVNTKSNPADDASRGLRAEELLNNRRWFDGPAFLWQPATEWPVGPIDATSDLAEIEDELKPIVCCVVNATNMNSNDCGILQRIFKRRSCLFKLMIDVAWFLRARQWLKAKATGVTMPDMRVGIKVAELMRAAINVVKYVQREAFPELTEKVKKTSCIYRLEPMSLDDDLLCNRVLGIAQVTY